MFYGFHATQEQIDAARRDHEAKVAALTPEERAWLTTEDDWKHTLARQEQESHHSRASEYAALLEEDINAYGQPG